MINTENKQRLPLTHSQLQLSPFLSWLLKKWKKKLYCIIFWAKYCSLFQKLEKNKKRTTFLGGLDQKIHCNKILATLEEKDVQNEFNPAIL